MDEDPADREDLPDVDWKYLESRLRAVATRWMRKQGCRDEEAAPPGTSVSAADLAAVTVSIIYQKRSWEKVSEPEGLYPYALRVMKNRYLDLGKSLEHKKTTSIETVSEGEPEEVFKVPNPHDVFDAVEARVLVDKTVRILAPDELVKAYLEAWLIKGLTRMEDIAFEMGVSVREATNAKRRLFPKLALLKRVFGSGGLKKGKQV